jgi:hypothetical protein
LKKFILLLTLNACIYSLTGFFPSEYRNVALFDIDNKTDYLQLSNLSKIAFEEYVLSEPRLNLKDIKNANVLVKIYINNYSREPEKYNQNGEIISYKYGVYIDIEFLKKDTTKILDKRSYNGFYIQPSLSSPDDGYKFAIKDAISRAFSDYFSSITSD